LGQNYPNPFNPITTIAYQLPADANVSVIVFNLLGQTVKTLKHADQSAGYYSVAWNGTDENNNPVSSGVYLYKIVAQSQGKELFVSTKKMLFLK
jgi:flagellar hook assembly protein FlgD